MGLKIKTKELTTFFKKIRMDGTQLLHEAIFKFEEEGLKIDANTATQQARVMALLKPSAFIDYEAIGNVPMNDLTNVVKVLERFGTELSLKKEGNLLTVFGKTKVSSKKVGIELPHESFLATDTTEPKLEFKDTFASEADIIKEIFSDIKINKDVVITIESSEKKVTFTNTGKYKFTHDIVAPSCSGGVKVKMGEPFMDVFTNLNGKVEISINTDFPAKIREVCEHSVVTIIVAPRSDEE